MSTKTRFALMLAVATSLAACGGSDNDPDSVFVPGSSVVGGIWIGTVDTGGVAEQIYGIVTEEGAFTFISDANVLYTGEITGAELFAGSFTSVAGLGFEFCAGVTSLEGQILSGRADKGESLFGDTVLANTCGAGTIRSTFSLTFNSLYERDSSFGAVAGMYTDTATGALVEVFPTGAIFSQDAGGCVMGGSIAPIEPRFNAYTISVEFSCAGDPRDGLVFDGLATLDPSDGVSTVIAGATSSAGGLVLVLERN